MPRHITDFFSFGGAGILAERIRRFWLTRGHTVDVRVEPMTEAGKLTHFVVRSDLLNALPRGAQ